MKSFDTLQIWLNFLEKNHPKKIDLGLERVRQIFKALGIVFECPVVTVAGTNGKGSTCKFLSSMFTEGKYRVACMTSPHLKRFNERACIGGQEVTDAQLLHHFEVIESTRKKLDPALSLTFFEFTTLAILHLFFQSSPDLVILEVGMGGRLDAVNIVDATCAIITNIAIDHDAYLGSTREAIGREKAGILRKRKPLVIGDPCPPKSLLQRADELECPTYIIGRDFDWELFEEGEAKRWNYINFDGQRLNLNTPTLVGKNQLSNASLALKAADLISHKLPLSDQNKKVGIVQTELRGRFQVFPGLPVKILDVAHNPHSANILAKNLLENGSYPCTHIIFGVFADKDILGIVQFLREQVDFWYFTLLPSERSASFSMLRLALKKAGFDTKAIKGEYTTPIEAYSAAIKNCKVNERIVVCGSFLTVSPLYDILDAQLEK